MNSRRLTKIQKAEILEAYRAGENANCLAGKYNCTPNTINRTVKTFLSEKEYTLLKRKRSRSSKKNEKSLDNKNLKEKKKDLEEKYPLILSEDAVEKEDLNIKSNVEYHSSEFDKIFSLAPLEDNNLYGDLLSDDQQNKNNEMYENNQNIDNFEEIVPLISSFDFDIKKQKSDFEILNYESLPHSVYMIVDKKVELELQPISDLPEWSFLPENELKRNAILLFANQRSAKRICSRNQRVIKIPNTSVFKLSKSYLISKGITRLILEDTIIGLDD